MNKTEYLKNSRESNQAFQNQESQRTVLKNVRIPQSKFYKFSRNREVPAPK